MPNYVANKVSIKGPIKTINKIRNYVSSDESCFDFNKIIPMPEELEMESGSNESVSIECAIARGEGKRTASCLADKQWARSRHTFDEWADIGDRYLKNKEQYGFTTWYEWCIHNWGTKWNACDPAWENENIIHFETAWAMPGPIYLELSRLYPDISIVVDYADEDLGCNCGQAEYSNGRENINYIDDFDFACEVWGLDPDEERALREKE